MSQQDTRGLAAILVPAILATAAHAQEAAAAPAKPIAQAKPATNAKPATQGQATPKPVPPGGFATPGMPARSAMPQQATDASGQTSGFSSVFNPAFAFVVDTLADYSDGDGDDGLELSLRSAELSAKSWIDPDAWAYFVAVAEEEGLAMEEAAIHYKGLGDTHTLRIGRFFLDFGKQMQAHVHDLRTVDRPLPLRAYLGSELGGDGVQWDAWTPGGETGALRWSLGVYGAINSESEDLEDLGIERELGGRKDLGDLAMTARLTSFMDIGEESTLQLGASWLGIPSYSAEGGSEEAEDLSQNVVGFDATYGFGADGEDKWTFGTEFLFASGDTTLGLDGGDLVVDDQGLTGFYLYGDWAFDPKQSVGLQLAEAELPRLDGEDASEIDIYYTRHISEYHRVRLAVRQSSIADEDNFALLVQYTGFVGAHAHGVNW
jgi:hypothetical protein